MKIWVNIIINRKLGMQLYQKPDFPVKKEKFPKPGNAAGRFPKELSGAIL